MLSRRLDFYTMLQYILLKGCARKLNEDQNRNNFVSTILHAHSKLAFGGVLVWSGVSSINEKKTRRLRSREESVSPISTT